MLKYKEGYWYQTVGRQSIQLPFACPDYTGEGCWVYICGGRLFTRNGYAWDGASFVLFRWFGTPRPWLVAMVAYYCVRVGGNFAVRTTNPVREVV